MDGGAFLLSDFLILTVLDCALGVHSASNQHNERRYEFYWGYKSHVLVDCISGLPLYELTTPGNIADSSVAAEILAAADQTVSLKECTFLADKGYDVKSIYNTVKRSMRARRLFPSIHAARKPLKRSLPVIRSARPGSPCTRTAKRPTMGVPARNTAVRFASPKAVFALVATRIGTTARRIGAARNIRPFPMTTGFPLTAAASTLNGLTPCGQSASVTILASNPQVRNSCECAMEPARQTSIRWPTSPL